MYVKVLFGIQELFSTDILYIFVDFLLFDEVLVIGRSNKESFLLLRFIFLAVFFLRLKSLLHISVLSMKHLEVWLIILSQH